jgi:predicted lipoprotein with Yx(FWY)xxD motif
VTKLRFLLAAALAGALALSAAEAGASTTTAVPRGAHGAAHAATHAKHKKKHHKKNKKESDTSRTAAPAGATVKVATIAAGSVLVGPDGRTLYVFDGDTTTTSACTGPCATVWPALTVTGTPGGGSGVDASKLTAAAQADGKDQVVYAGHLLYSFSGDTAPGDAKGLGIPAWHAVSPAGTPVGGS